MGNMNIKIKCLACEFTRTFHRVISFNMSYMSSCNQFHCFCSIVFLGFSFQVLELQVLFQTIHRVQLKRRKERQTKEFWNPNNTLRSKIESVKSLPTLSSQSSQRQYNWERLFKWFVIFFVAFTHITCRVYKWLNMSGVLFMDLFHPLIYRLMRL